MPLYQLPYSVDFELTSDVKIPRPDEAIGLPIDARELLKRVDATGHLDFDSLRVIDRQFIWSDWEGQSTERYCPVQFVPAAEFHPTNCPAGTLYFRLTKFPWDDSSFPRRYRLQFDILRGGGQQKYVADVEDNCVPLTTTARPGSAEIRRADGSTLLAFSQPPGRKPGFHPLTTPAGHIVTGERPVDHIWHRGLWFAWTEVFGERTPVRPYTFWGEPRTGVIHDLGMSRIFDGPLVAGFTHRSVWATEDGVPLFEMRMEATAQQIGQAWALFDLATTLTASADQAVTLKTGYGHFNLRSSPQLRGLKPLDSAAGTEAITDNADQREIAVKWTGFSGRDAITDTPLCAMLCDTPSNQLPGEDRPCHRDFFFEPKRPYPRENGLPFLVTSMNPIRNRPLTIPAGQSRSWQYRVVTSDRDLSAEFGDTMQNAVANSLTLTFK